MKITKTEYKEYIQYTNELNQLHREDGPAEEYTNGMFKGTKHWFQNDKLHRLDGPAREFSNGIKYWYYHGKRIDCETQKEFERLIKLAILW